MLSCDPFTAAHHAPIMLVAADPTRTNSASTFAADDVDVTKIRPDVFDGKHWEEAIQHYVR